MVILYPNAAEAISRLVTAQDFQSRARAQVMGSRFLSFGVALLFQLPENPSRAVAVIRGSHLAPLFDQTGVGAPWRSTSRQA